MNEINPAKDNFRGTCFLILLTHDRNAHIVTFVITP